MESMQAFIYNKMSNKLVYIVGEPVSKEKEIIILWKMTENRIYSIHAAFSPQCVCRDCQRIEITCKTIDRTLNSFNLRGFQLTFLLE